MPDQQLAHEPQGGPKSLFFAPTPEHPEEMIADIGFRIGEAAEFRARARCTPAGVITTGLAAAAVLLATAWLVRAVNAR